MGCGGERSDLSGAQTMVVEKLLAINKVVSKAIASDRRTNANKSA